MNVADCEGCARLGARAMRDGALIVRYVEQNSRWPGSDGARSAGFGVSVWAIVAYHRAAGGDRFSTGIT